MLPTSNSNNGKAGKSQRKKRYDVYTHTIHYTKMPIIFMLALKHKVGTLEIQPPHIQCIIQKIYRYIVEYHISYIHDWWFYDVCISYLSICTRNQFDFWAIFRWFCRWYIWFRNIFLLSSHGWDVHCWSKFKLPSAQHKLSTWRMREWVRETKKNSDKQHIRR